MKRSKTESEIRRTTLGIYKLDHEISKNILPIPLFLFLNGDEFKERMALSFEMGGAAYSESDAYLISRHLEKLVAQGAYVIQPNELLGSHS